MMEISSHKKKIDGMRNVYRCRFNFYIPMITKVYHRRINEFIDECDENLIAILPFGFGDGASLFLYFLLAVCASNISQITMIA